MSTSLTRLNMDVAHQMDSLSHQSSDTDLDPKGSQKAQVGQGFQVSQDSQNLRDSKNPKDSSQHPSESKKIDPPHDSSSKPHIVSELMTLSQMDEDHKDEEDGKDQGNHEVSSPSDRPIFTIGEPEEENWLKKFTKNFAKYRSQERRV